MKAFKIRSNFKLLIIQVLNWISDKFIQDKTFVTDSFLQDGHVFGSTIIWKKVFVTHILLQGCRRARAYSIGHLGSW